MTIVTDETPLGCSGLLRVAGLPIRYWLSGANPNLFADVERLECHEAARQSCAIQLADRIGQELVPNPALSRDDRAFLLAVRRSLHRGDPISDISHEHLLNVAGLSGADADLVQTLVAMVDRDREIAILSAEVDADVVKEQDRLLLLPEHIYHESPLAKALLPRRGTEKPGLGSQPSRKQRQHRFDHAWHRVTRAATVSTPREWLSHVALLRVEAAAHLSPPAVTGQFTARWTENVQALRLALMDPPDDWPTPDSRLAMNPLHWDTDAHLVAVVLDRDEALTQVSVRHMLLLDAIRRALADSVVSFGELAQVLGYVSEDELFLLRGFVRHLVVVGILQLSAPPLVRLEKRATPGDTFAQLTGAEGNQSGWVDVYRYGEIGISASLALEVQRGVSQALRVLSLMGEDTSVRHPWAIPSSTGSWAFTDIVRAELSGGHTAVSSGAVEIAGCWSSVASADPGYGRFVREFVERAWCATDLVIDSHLLDECAATSGVLTWPVDCLVRVPVQGAGFTAVLDSLWPPGKLDARFADALVDMHGIIPHVEAYRSFLRRLEQLTGIRFVELLAPPLTSGAANAVRRPTYTSAWTGDRHTDAYLHPGADPGCYIPLNAIRIRRVEGRLRADVDGQPIWPVYHATRSFSPPWDRLARILLATAPLDVPVGYERANHSLKLLPTLLADRPMVPRISVSGGIVLSPAQWRVSPDQLWDCHGSTKAKVRALIRLRNRYSLPRWVHLIRGGNKPSVCCDLESILALRTLERCSTGGAPVNLVEMLPAPDQFLAIDRAHGSEDRLATQLQLRFPCDESATAMATRVAPAILAALGSTGSVPVGSGSVSRCHSEGGGAHR